MVVVATHHQAALPIRLPTVAHHQAAHRSEEVHHRLAEAAEALRLVEAADNITQICHIKRIDKDNIGLSNLTTSPGKEACGRL